MMLSAIQRGVDHGRKRPADEDLEGEQRLTKRFNNLQLNYNQHGPTIRAATALPPKPEAEEMMYVDDTKDRVFIHDLDAELAEIENSEPQIAFLPEIEKKLAAFPSLLETRVLSPSEGQLILYKPISFSDEIKGEQRKRIIAERRKARGEDRQLLQNDMPAIEAMDEADIDDTKPPTETPQDDPDAMEIG